MKELYISPELNVLCFAPVERLAATSFPFKELQQITASGTDDGENYDSTIDAVVPLDL